MHVFAKDISFATEWDYLELGEAIPWLRRAVEAQPSLDFLVQTHHLTPAPSPLS